MFCIREENFKARFPNPCIKKRKRSTGVQPEAEAGFQNWAGAARAPAPPRSAQPAGAPERARPGLPGRPGEEARLQRSRRWAGRAGRAGGTRLIGRRTRASPRGVGSSAIPGQGQRRPSDSREPAAKRRGGGHLTTRTKNKVARQLRGHALSGRPARDTPSRGSSYPDLLGFLLLLWRRGPKGP